MDNTQVTPFFKAKNHKSYEELSVAHAMSCLNAVKFDEYNGQGRIINNNNNSTATMSNKAITPKEAMQGLANLEALKEALTIFFQKNSTKELSNNIKTVPTFFEPQVERLELSENTKETFARIGARARKEFIEEQIARAFQYNIPFNIQNVNFLELSQKIDEYEELLTTAREQGIDWDVSHYDPVHLRQAIDDQESYYRQERIDLYSCFAATRGLEV